MEKKQLGPRRALGLFTSDVGLSWQCLTSLCLGNLICQVGVLLMLVAA